MILPERRDYHLVTYDILIKNGLGWIFAASTPCVFNTGKNVPFDDKDCDTHNPLLGEKYE